MSLARPASLAGAVEKLNCIGEQFNRRFDYSVLLQNCGEFTKKILEVSGFKYDINPNLGIGSDSLLTDTINEATGRSNSIRAGIDEAVAVCEQRFDDLMTTLRQLENGEPINFTALNFKTYTTYTIDARLHVLLAAARGKLLTRYSRHLRVAVMGELRQCPCP